MERAAETADWDTFFAGQSRAEPRPLLAEGLASDRLRVVQARLEEIVARKPSSDG